jgi:WhiB family redox-sensing transcriptional regulator
MPKPPREAETATSLTLISHTLMSDLQQSGFGGQDLPCHSVDPDLFFAERPRDVERSKRVCDGCPVRAECLQGALERQEPWGVWGGELVRDGAVIAYKRGRGRPRTIDVA